MSDHEWAEAFNRRGKPIKQRQCTKCDIYETELSHTTSCPPDWQNYDRRKLEELTIDQTAPHLASQAGQEARG